MPRPTHLLVVLGLALAATAVWNNAAALSGGRRDTLPSPRPADGGAAVWQGVASCAAAACHHGNGPKGSVGSEYTTWANYDPHARAYASLLLKRSQAIVKNLAAGKEHKPAHQDSKCLNCHVQPDYDRQSRGERFTVEDGVGCEACHGAAEKWRTAHYNKEKWERLPIPEKAARGMLDTKTILGRARVCVDCHVGAPGMDVNHDLIAAGHPRLHFEFAAYHALMPHHWKDAKDKTPPLSKEQEDRRPGRKDFEAQAWAVGQVVSARAALKLLEHRAAKEVWPEFAEYDCFACHHSLKEPSWRQRQEPGKRKPGSYPWGSWYQGMVPRALAIEGGGGETFLAALDGLRREMEMPGPTREDVAQKSREAADSLDLLLARLEKPAAVLLPVPTLFRAIAREEGKGAEASWDRAAQYYLALAALHHAWRDTRQAPVPPEVRPALRDLAGQLSFPRGFNSPLHYAPAEVRKRVSDLQRLVTK